MQTHLSLPFTPIVGRLLHPSQLDANFIANPIPQSDIGSVSVKHFDLSVVTDVSLRIDKHFIVESEIGCSLLQLSAVKRNIHE